MKYVSYIVFCAILLCCPTLRSQSALTLSAVDVKFLSDCGVLQVDIKAIPKLPSDGQDMISLILSSKARKCNNLKHFIDTRDFLRKFTHPRASVPCRRMDMNRISSLQRNWSISTRWTRALSIGLSGIRGNCGLNARCEMKGEFCL